ncbi:MAG: STAS domain-containing protein [Oscillospiraceae bacterium]|nr:STAS domain-containing protein [Oscillospiraceae bacterium]
MTIDKKTNGTELEMTLTGRLDTTTAPMFEAEITNSISSVEKLVLNFENLDYISSAGLRVVLSAQKIMNNQGKMIIRNVGDGIMEIFEITGFLDILTIE